MRFLYLIIALFLLANHIALSQKHDYIWMFGRGPQQPAQGFGSATLDFNDEPPSVSNQYLSIPFAFTASTYSDSSGSLLFYSNGIKIMNKDKQIMENGNMINPGQVWNNFKDDGYLSFFSHYGIPDPGNPTGVYFLHTGIDISNGIRYSPFYYSYIDLSANNGLGRVTIKNIVLDTGHLVIPVFVKHGNGRDWWIITGQYNKTIQKVFLIDSDGLSLKTISNLGFSFPVEEGDGISGISPNGELYIRNDVTNGMRLFDFNRCTGELSNFRLQIVRDTLKTGNITFSEDGEYLYMNDNTRLVEQIPTATLDSPYVLLDSLSYWDAFLCGPLAGGRTRFGFSGRGPDGKIYWENLNETQCLNVLHNPELPSEAADMGLHGVHLNRYNDFTIYRFPNYRLGRWVGSPCDTIQMTIYPEGFTDTYYDAEKWAKKPNEQASSEHPNFPTGQSDRKKAPNPYTPKALIEQRLREKGIIKDTKE